MSAHASPNIITDGLAFMYDTGSGKSYRGEPTINYIHSQNAVAQDSYSTWSATAAGTYNAKHPNAIAAYNAAGTQISGYYNGGVGDATNTYHAHWQYDPILKKPVVVMNDLVSGQWKAKWMGTGMGSWASYGKGHGDTYTISWLQWVDNLSKHAKAGLYRRRASDNANNFWDGQASSASSYNTKLRTWQRVYHTFTTSSVVDLNSTYLSIYMYGHYSPRATVKVADVQFTWGSHPAQFSAEYERTATQGLLDLTNTSTIDLSNVSFDSDAQMTFDGTDDYITAGNPTELQFIYSDPFSLEVWIKADDLSGFNHVIGKTYGNYRLSVTSSGYSFRLDSNNLTTNAGTPVVGEWQHVVATWEPSTSTARVYVNGVLEQSVTDATVDWTYTSANFQLGNSPGENYHFNGTIPAARVYSKTVTAEEVLQNYNATKSRFGL